MPLSIEKKDSYSAAEIIDALGISRGAFYEIVKKGYFAIEYSEGEPGRYEIKTRQIEVHPDENERCFTDEDMWRYHAAKENKGDGSI